MRRLMLSLFGLSFLMLLAGCATCGSCGSCGAGGCGPGGSGLLDGTHRTWSHGVCDCEFDDHCLTRAGWLRIAPATLGTPVENVPPPKVLPKDLPDIR